MNPSIRLPEHIVLSLAGVEVPPFRRVIVTNDLDDNIQPSEGIYNRDLKKVMGAKSS
jgi:hypothetical protein